MEFLEWNNKTMSIGIKLIDEQHKELLKIINKLSISINENSQRKDILTIIDELIDYGYYHFRTEEELFDKFNYEEADIHVIEHTNFINKFTTIKEKISKNKMFRDKSSVEVAENIFQYIINWFLNHVVVSDRKFVPLFKDNGCK
mgnify:CR=1 FL=1